MISNVSSSLLTTRPATAIDENDAMAPSIQSAALKVGVMAATTGLICGYSHSIVAGGLLDTS